MQRGIAVTMQHNDRPSNQFIYGLICKELNQTICKREQCKVELKRCNDKTHQSFLLDQIDKFEIEFGLLNKLKASIEHPEYYDEVYDGDS